MPNDLNFTQVVKNEYFTHLQVNGTETRFRAMEQIWNAQGIAMRVQGGGGDGGDLNGFGKRHLLASHDGTSGMQKAASVLSKRMGGKGATGREKKARGIVHAAVPRADFLADRKFDKDKFNKAQSSARTALDAKYDRALYGPSTDICTFVLLDGFDANHIKEIFANAILDAGPWNIPNEKAVEFRFETAVVFELNSNGTRRNFMGFSAQVKYTGRYYDIYHMNSGIDPV
jgi:hypothetical protein